MMITHPLQPVYNKDTKILILGSFPSVISRREGFYYANKQNRFFKIFEQLFHLSLLTTQDKIDFLYAYHIGLYDVIYSCEIEGSSDSSIKNVKVSNIKEIIEQSKVDTIFVTGKKALELYNRYLKDDLKIEAIYLPSPSGANAKMRLSDLVEAYQIILEKLS